MVQKEKLCFVIMPFSGTKVCNKKHWEGIYYNLFEKTIKRLARGYQVKRADSSGGVIMKNIISNLHKADLVLADITDAVPNVMYELGVRHTLRKKTIIIAQEGTAIPFDLKDCNVIFYRDEIPYIDEFFTKIRNRIREMEKNPDKVDNSVADYLSQKNIILEDTEKKNILKKLSSLLFDLNFNRGMIIQLKKKLSTEGNKNLIGMRIYPRFRLTSLNLLIDTYYLDIEEKTKHLLYSTLLNLEILNKMFDFKIEEDIIKKMMKMLGYSEHTLIELTGKIENIITDFQNNNFPEIGEVKIPILDEKIINMMGFT